MTAAGAEALARLIDAVHPKRVAHLKICSAMLPFAMAARQKPVLPLIVCTFPFVYEELRRDSDGFDIIKLFMFVDWDKCKMARKDLVRAFMASSWPPVDLAVTACRSRELSRFFKLLLRERGGDEYLTEIEAGSQSLKKALRMLVLEAIREARASGSAISDWET